MKIIEVDVEPAKGYDVGHIRNAIGWNCQTDLCDTTIRDLINPRAFSELCRRAGVSPDDTVVLYGDMNNWFAARAPWQFKYHGHTDARLMNGGRKKWELEKRPYTTDRADVRRSCYPIPASDKSIRAYRDEVLDSLGQAKINLLDVRSPDEFSGKIIAPPGIERNRSARRAYPRSTEHSLAENRQRGWHVKSADELRKLYPDAGVDFSKPTIAYCRIGERSSHTWFVLHYLLGVKNVKNYDGSWTEWGNLVGVAIERRESPPQAAVRS